MRDGRVRRAKERVLIADDLQLSSTEMTIEFQLKMNKHIMQCKHAINYGGIAPGVRGGQRVHLWHCTNAECKDPELRQELMPSFRAAETGKLRSTLPTSLVNASKDAAVGIDAAMLLLKSLGIGNAELSKSHLYDLSKEANAVQIQLAYTNCERNLEEEKALSRAKVDYGGDLDGHIQVAAEIDGVYGVRSQANNYARASQVAATCNGSLTKKPIGLGLRSQTCRTCEHWERAGKPIPEHDHCTRNLAGSIIYGEGEASGDLMDQVAGRGGAITEATTDGDSKNLAALQAKVSHPIRPGLPGAVKRALSIFHSESVLHGASVWARGALSGPNRGGLWPAQWASSTATTAARVARSPCAR